ncbi:unnamed protein product [Rhodiola kirilowii]
MDVPQTPPALSLGFNSHDSVLNRLPLVDDSTSPQVSSSLCAETDCEEEDEDEGQEFRVFGHSMRVKRPRESSSSSSSSNRSKRIAIDGGMEARRAAVRAWGSQPIHIADPDVFEIMEKEKSRQCRGIELIASENFVCRAVMEALGSHLTNKYSEGMPGSRYYTGNLYIDQLELFCCKRALAAFHELGCQRPALLLYFREFRYVHCIAASGGKNNGLGFSFWWTFEPRLLHSNWEEGFWCIYFFFQSLPYKVNPHTGYIDHDKLEEKALDFRPKLLICGGSSYPRVGFRRCC